MPATKASAARSPDAVTGAPGRPVEIESPSNIYLIHPLSRLVAGALVATPVTPNMVSVSSMLFALAGSLSYLYLASPWGAFLGLLLMGGWHVLDGADGDLARRTGRASPIGELVDGICDHASQGMLYIALALMAAPALGGWVWALAFGAALSHFVQANAYESGRKTYRRWVYGAAWMRQAAPEGGGIAGFLSGLYLFVANATSPGEAKVEAAMERPLSGEAAGATRNLYRARFAPIISAAGWMGSNSRTFAAFAAVLIGAPQWFFIYELTALNVVLLVTTVWRARCNASFAAALNAA